MHALVIISFSGGLESVDSIGGTTPPSSIRVTQSSRSFFVLGHGSVLDHSLGNVPEIAKLRIFFRGLVLAINT